MEEVVIERTFMVTFNDSEVYERCVENKDGWRSMFYNLQTREDVARHLAWNIGMNGWRLSQLDGWADLPDDAVEVQEME